MTFPDSDFGALERADGICEKPVISLPIVKNVRIRHILH